MIKIVNLYVEEVNGDQRRITAEIPLTSGTTPVYDGHAVVGIETPAGTMERPITFSIVANTIEEAFEKFEEARRVEGPKEAKKMIDDMRQQMIEHQEKNRSKIVIPGSPGSIPQ